MAETVDTEATVVETTKVVKMKALTPELTEALINYLQTKPYAEVSNLISSLSSPQISPIIDVTFTNANGSPDKTT